MKGGGRTLRKLANTLLVFVAAGCVRPTAEPAATADRSTTAGAARPPLRVIVMDPLSDQLACDCVAGYAQRRYDALGRFLEQQLQRRVTIAYGENLADVLARAGGQADLIIGKQSVVSFDAARRGVAIRTLALLTDRDGTTDLTGLFVVRQASKARAISDLRGATILFGPAEADEKHAAALAALRAQGVPVPATLATAPGCSSAALAVVEQRADACVISSYALPLLEGCKAIDKGALRVIGRTAPVPFITVFATASVARADEERIVAALLAVRADPNLLKQMESRDGFVRLPPEHAAAAAEWTDWRGPNRAGLSPAVPEHLPAKVTFAWRRPLSGVSLAGVAATTDLVLVADKDNDGKDDVFRCLDARSGAERWTLRYPAAGELDYGNAPRASPVIRDGLVYLLGAFGDLHCVRLDTGEIVWKRNIVVEFGAKRPTWGMCAAPLIVDDKLIVNPGAPDAALVALDRRTGRTIWQTPGAPAGYAAFILGVFGGVRQIVGYDTESLGGWNPETGARLWRLVPENEGDFNVPTPVAVDDRLLVATENNGTRLYGFADDGMILPRPVAQNQFLAPDVSTPVVLGDRVFGCCRKLYCLSRSDGLRPVWTDAGDAFSDVATLIAGNGRVLILAASGELALVHADAPSPIIETRTLFTDTEVWSHPALVGDRLYVRSRREIVCILLSDPVAAGPGTERESAP